MDTQINIKKYLPLTEATYYILISLLEPLHGYGIMQNVEKISDSEVRLGPGTLYGALSKLEKEKLIQHVSSSERKKYYQLTEGGKKLVQLEFRRLTGLIKNSKNVIERMEENNEQK
jgi:DNA-binding PadR family transcriptional regulator